MHLCVQSLSCYLHFVFVQPSSSIVLFFRPYILPFSNITVYILSGHKTCNIVCRRNNVESLCKEMSEKYASLMQSSVNPLQF